MVNMNVPYSRPNNALKTLVNELYDRWGLPARAPEYVTGYKSPSNLTGHNADSNGIVHAVDLFFSEGSKWTPARGKELAELLRKEGPRGAIPGHPDRMYYIIYQDRIAGDFSDWEWMGSGYGHWDHIHVSTCDMYWGDPAPISYLEYDSTAPWNLWSVTSTSVTVKGTTVAISDADAVKLASVLWNTRIQQYNADKSKLSVQKAAYILGNISQCFSRVLDGQKNIRNDIAALRAEVAALNTKTQTTIQNTLASSVVKVDVSVAGK